MGKARALVEIRSLARSHRRIRVLVGIMRSEDATPAARVSAANAILDRGWGKATQTLDNGSDGAIELIHRIERVMFIRKARIRIRILDYYEAVGQVLAFHVNWLRSRGYYLFSPTTPWAWSNTLYWRKDMK